MTGEPRDLALPVPAGHCGHWLHYGAVNRTVVEIRCRTCNVDLTPPDATSEASPRKDQP